jgi:phosphoglycolate phosphatase
MKETASHPPRGRVLMFDLDGTLIDSGRDIAAAVNLLRAVYGLPQLPLQTIVSYVGDGLRVLVQRSLRGHRLDLDEATRVCAKHYRHHLHDKTVLYPGVKQGLKRLRRAGYLLAVITNKPADAASEILNHLSVAECFSAILGGGDTKHLKPHPEPLLVTMKRMGARREESWMIGDHKTDLEAARRAGIRSAFLTYGIGQRGHEKPARVFSTFKALTEFFLP